MSKSRAFVCLLLTAIVFSSLGYATTADRISNISSGPAVALRGNVHHKALPQNDLGRVNPGMRLGSMTLLTVPTVRQRRALKQLLAQQQDRKSPNYHKWLIPEQWADRFGLSQKDIQQISAWLKAQGFTIGTVARGRNWITFSGTAAQVERTFGTEIHNFKWNGEIHVANASEPKIPAALAGVVTGIRGLNDFHLKPRRKARPYYFASTLNTQFLAPGDLAMIYDINPLYTATTPIDGTGQKLAVIGQTDVYLTDLNDFRSGFGLTTISGANCATNTSGVVMTPCNDPLFDYVLVGTSDPLTPLSGDLSEADLDLELSGAVARNAQLIYVNAPAVFSGNNLVSGGVWQAWYYAVDNNLAPVISLSYGLCEFDDNNVLPATGQAGPDEVELQKANSLGITFVNSTGDTGTAECDFGGTGGTLTSTNQATQGLAVGYPASSPEVTGVGGTAIPLANFSATYWGQSNGSDGGTALSYVPEQPWNDDAEFFEYCQAHGSSTFCSNGNGSGLAITSEASAQNAIGISSAGGGISNCAVQSSNNSNCVSGFGQPSWQTVTISGQTSARYTPDVSFLASANFPGYIFCTELSELGMSGTGSSCAPGGSAGISNAVALTLNSKPNPSVIGGTSASAPIFAGMVTLLNQFLGSSGLGNVNPTLYSLAKTAGTFHPITTGDNNVSCQAGTPVAPWPVALQCPTAGVFGYSASSADASTGYNLVTGLGSVDANNLALSWQAASTSTFSLTPNAASFAVAQGSSIDATIDVNFASGFSGPVTFTCTDPASESTCTVPPDASATGPVTFHITTTGPTGELRRPFDRGMRIFYAALLPGLLGIMFTVSSGKRSSAAIRLLGMITVLGVSTLWISSCGGSSGGVKNPGTPKNSYTVKVTGTSGSDSSSASFQLVVQ
jgi:hypothetical protein